MKALVEKTDARTLADAVVVVDMPLAGTGFRGKPVLYPKTFPESQTPFPTSRLVVKRPLGRRSLVRGSRTLISLTPMGTATGH